MAKDPLQLLLEHLRAQEGAPIPTSSLGRLRRTAVAGARVGLAALAGRLRGRDLSVSYGIVHERGGHLEVDSAPGRGTCVSVLLPLDAAV